MNEVEGSILKAIQANPLASQQELADNLGLSRESIAGYISRLTRKGAILGKGYILPRANSVVVIGGANADIAGTSTDVFHSCDSNPGKVQQSAGGVGRNIAENLARLGNDVSMITVVGKDSRGHFLIDHAVDAGIKVQDFVQHPELATSTYLALHNQSGELMGAIADMAIMAKLSPELLATKMSRLQAASTLIVDANIPIESISWLAEQNLSAFIVADGVSAAKAVRLVPLLHKINLLKVNRHEALAILSRDDSEELTGSAIIAALLEKGVATILLSLAEEGVLVGNAEGNLQQTVPMCNMVSDTGAGDALLAGFVHSGQLYAQGIDRIKFAIACAATTLEAKEAVNPLLSETYVTKRFNQFLNQSDYDSADPELEN